MQVIASVALIGGLYAEYNKKKEEKERRIGYLDNRRTYHIPRGESNGNTRIRERKINTRMLLARCIYGMYYRVREHPEYTSWWDDVEYDLVSNEDVLQADTQLYSAGLQKEKKDRYFGVLRRRENYPARLDNHDAPEWIVAVRGTDLCTFEDYRTDAKIFTETLELENTNFKLLHAVVKRLTEFRGPNNVVLTGHSLGAAAGMLVARKLAEEGILVKAHLFNPPFATVSELVRLTSRVGSRAGAHNEIRTGMLRFTDVLMQELAVLSESDQLLGRRDVNGWTPNLYVNTGDLISRQDVEHFKEYEQGHEELPTLNRFHLLPRATLHVSNKFSQLRPISAHMLWNWTRPDLPYEFTEENING